MPSLPHRALSVTSRKQELAVKPYKRSKRCHCGNESQMVISLLSFAVSIIIKGVAYDNSRWAIYEQVDVFNHKEQFPIMSSFIGKFVTT